MLAGDCDRVWSSLRPVVDHPPAADRDEVLGGTAVRCYRIDPDRLGGPAAPS